MKDARPTDDPTEWDAARYKEWLDDHGYVTDDTREDSFGDELRALRDRVREASTRDEQNRQARDRTDELHGTLGYDAETGDPIVQMAECGHCGARWNNAVISDRTPVLSARCPFEYDHEYPPEPDPQQDAAARTRAQRLYPGPDISVDENARVIWADEPNGAVWVQAWIWLDREEIHV